MHPLQPNQVSVAGSVEGDDLDDYQRIAAAIAFLRAHRVKQPDLAAVAQHLHLSESHVQRLFTCWAGITAMGGPGSAPAQLTGWRSPSTKSAAGLIWGSDATCQTPTILRWFTKTVNNSILRHVLVRLEIVT